MTPTRDDIAIEAMRAIIARYPWDTASIARHAYDMADAMLQARQQTQPIDPLTLKKL